MRALCSLGTTCSDMFTLNIKKGGAIENTMISEQSECNGYVLFVRYASIFAEAHNEIVDYVTL